MKTLWRRAQIVGKAAAFIWALIIFRWRLARAKKETDLALKRKIILELIVDLLKKIPYELPGLLSVEFKEENGGKES
jgi:hypothetical protein